ncbi:MAG TPA: hypothetical protein VID48_01680 [Solirubrobacteraceae bacterium]
MNRTLRCQYCKDVIGVYEPMIVRADGEARKTSRATEPDNTGPIGQCYHDACYVRAREQEQILE